MDHKKHYDRLIETRKLRQREKGIKYERHHIIMKSMGGSNNEDNLVYLTPREHFIAHRLLWLIHRNKQAAWAFRFMCYMNNTWSSKIYEELRQDLSQSDETKLKLRNANIGKRYSPDVNKTKGRSVSKSLEHKNKIGKALKNNPKIIGKISYTKPVLQFDLNNNLLAKWESALIAAMNLKICNTGISQCCNGKIRTFKKFIWKFEFGDLKIIPLRNE